jgi:hypothetical protein
MDVSQLTAESSTTAGGKRRGRKPKAAAVQAEPKTKRKYTRRKPVAPPAERSYAIFLGEEGLQLVPTGGGDPLELTFADALAIAAFVARHRAALES